MMVKELVNELVDHGEWRFMSWLMMSRWRNLWIRSSFVSGDELVSDTLNHKLGKKQVDDLVNDKPSIKSCLKLLDELVDDC